MRVLLVEDEPVLRQQLVSRLRSEGYTVDVARDGIEGLARGNRLPVDVAILDLELQRLAGVEVLRAWRAEGRTFPVLMLGDPDRSQAKSVAVDAGADEVLDKPVHVRRLLARLRHLSRCARGPSQSQLSAGGMVLDTGVQAVITQGSRVRLTAFECRVLECLMAHAGEIVSKSELTRHLYDGATQRGSNVLEVLIGRLRRKLDPQRKLAPIETLHGRGYRFRSQRRWLGAGRPNEHNAGSGNDT